MNEPHVDIPNAGPVDDQLVNKERTALVSGHDEEKQGFLRKVFGIVTFQLAFTFSLAFIASVSPSFGAFCMHSATVIVSLVFLIIAIIGALVMKNIVPWNYMYLGVFTLSMSLLLSSATALVDPTIVLTAIVLTLVMSTGLTVFAFIASTEAIIYYLLCVLALALVQFIVLILAVSGQEWAVSAYYALGAFLYGMYLVIDTYRIREMCQVDDYIPAAIIIYMDIIRIFIQILIALSKKK